MVVGPGDDNRPILTYFVPKVAVWCIDVHFEALLCNNTTPEGWRVLKIIIHFVRSLMFV